MRRVISCFDIIGIFILIACAAIGFVLTSITASVLSLLAIVLLLVFGEKRRQPRDNATKDE